MLMKSLSDHSSAYKLVCLLIFLDSDILDKQIGVAGGCKISEFSDDALPWLATSSHIISEHGIKPQRSWSPRHIHSLIMDHKRVRQRVGG